MPPAKRPKINPKPKTNSKTNAKPKTTKNATPSELRFGVFTHNKFPSVNLNPKNPITKGTADLFRNYFNRNKGLYVSVADRSKHPVVLLREKFERTGAINEIKSILEAKKPLEAKVKDLYMEFSMNRFVREIFDISKLNVEQQYHATHTLLRFLDPTNNLVKLFNPNFKGPVTPSVKPSAKPAATTTPKPTPTATPAAKPAATPVSKPAPAASPAASPSVKPSTTPVAKPATAATPVSKPAPAATPKPSTTPAATPAPKSATHATPTPSATPTAKPAATTTPAASPSVKPSTTPTPKSSGTSASTTTTGTKGTSTPGKKAIKTTKPKDNISVERINHLNKILKTNYTPEYKFTGFELDAIAKKLIFIETSKLSVEEINTVNHFKQLEQKRLERILTKDGTISKIEKMIRENPNLSQQEILDYTNKLIVNNNEIHSMFDLKKSSEHTKTKIYEFVSETTLLYIERNKSNPTIKRRLISNVREIIPKIKRRVRVGEKKSGETIEINPPIKSAETLTRKINSFSKAKNVRELIRKFGIEKFEIDYKRLRDFVNLDSNRSHPRYLELEALAERCELLLNSMKKVNENRTNFKGENFRKLIDIIKDPKKSYDLEYFVTETINKEPPIKENKPKEEPKTKPKKESIISKIIKGAKRYNEIRNPKTLESAINSAKNLNTKIKRLEHARNIEDLIRKFNINSFEKSHNALMEFVKVKENRSHAEYLEFETLAEKSKLLLESMKKISEHKNLFEKENFTKLMELLKDPKKIYDLEQFVWETIDKASQNPVKESENKKSSSWFKRMFEKKPVDRILNSENILKTRLESLNNSKTIRELISKFNFRSFEKNLEILREFVSNKTNQSHKNYQEIVELTQRCDLLLKSMKIIRKQKSRINKNKFGELIEIIRDPKRITELENFIFEAVRFKWSSSTIDTYNSILGRNYPKNYKFTTTELAELYLNLSQKTNSGMTVDERGINAINVALNASYKPGDYTYKELADIFEAIAKKERIKILGS